MLIHGNHCYYVFISWDKGWHWTRDILSSGIMDVHTHLALINQFQRFKFGLYRKLSEDVETSGLPDAGYFRLTGCASVCLWQVGSFDDHHRWPEAAAVLLQQPHIPVHHCHLYCALFQVWLWSLVRDHAAGPLLYVHPVQQGNPSPEGHLSAETLAKWPLGEVYTAVSFDLLAFK